MSGKLTKSDKLEIAKSRRTAVKLITDQMNRLSRQAVKLLAGFPDLESKWKEKLRLEIEKYKKLETEYTKLMLERNQLVEKNNRREEARVNRVKHRVRGLRSLCNELGIEYIDGCSMAFEYVLSDIRKMISEGGR